jgi:dephospho-CoA kinase
MRILGLTGSIGMGKTTATQLLRRLHIPVHDADATVHLLMGPGGVAVSKIAREFPGSVSNGAIDRARLGAMVFGGKDPTALRRLEGILHPMVRAETLAWLAAQARRRVRVVALDIPLLFESRRRRSVDAVVVVSAPAFLQRQRVLRRPGMTDARLRDILSRQMPDSVKRRRADFVVTSGLGKRPTLDGLRRVLRTLTPRRAWKPGYR